MRYLFSIVILFSLLSFTSCKKERIGADKDYKELGSSAKDFLTSTRYPSILVEVSYMPGFAPDRAVLTILESFLISNLHKPEGVSFQLKEIASKKKESLNLDELVKIEKETRSLFTDGNQLTVHILITDGLYSTDQSLLALSYWNTSICLFGKSLQEYTRNLNQIPRVAVVGTLLSHEFGHLAGLVDQGSPMQTQHRDFSNGAHCNNPQCLMFYQIENGTNLLSLPSLDSACRKDLVANGGR